jgi:hypothetical protein
MSRNLGNNAVSPVVLAGGKLLRLQVIIRVAGLLWRIVRRLADS